MQRRRFSFSSLSTFIGCVANTDWPRCLPLKLRDVIDIDSAAELEERCLDWERYCDDQRRRAEWIAQRAQ